MEEEGAYAPSSCAGCSGFFLTGNRGGNFDGYVAIQAGIMRLPHFAHSTRADGRKNFIRAEFVAYGKRHARDLSSVTVQNNE
jgi:hypothetical protein